MNAFLARSRCGGVALALLAGLLLTGCEYEVPLSAQPVRPVEDTLVGNWMSPGAWMMVRRFDADHYVVVHNGSTFRVWHSDVAGRPFVTVQPLDAENPKFSYLTFQLSEDRRRLDVRFVRDEVIPKTITSTAAMRRAIEQQGASENFLSNVAPFVRMP